MRRRHLWIKRYQDCDSALKNKLAPLIYSAGDVQQIAVIRNIIGMVQLCIVRGVHLLRKKRRDYRNEIMLCRIKSNCSDNGCYTCKRS